MAADELLLQKAADQGDSYLRFYKWTEPTVSLGYFQSHKEIHQAKHLEILPLVRRPSGGFTLVHDREITYSLILASSLNSFPAPFWLQSFHEVIQTTLNRLEVDSKLSKVDVPSDHFLCFKHHTKGDLLIGTNKIVGSAQRRSKGALLQHGAILLSQSVFTPQLPGIRELAGIAINEDSLVSQLEICLVQKMSWKLKAVEWSEIDQRDIEELERNKYRQDAWTRKR